MEQQLYTRTTLTGAMLVVAFVLLWLPSPYSDNLTTAIMWVDQHNITTLVGLLTAILLTTPVVGFVIGTVVQALWYIIWGQPYNDRVRKEFKESAIQAIDRDGCSALASHVQAMRSPDIFYFFYYACAPKELIEWSRRRRTAEHLGYYWTVAVLTGGALGYAVHPEWHTASKLPSVLSLFAFLSLAVALSLHAKRDANEFERLWGRMFIAKKWWRSCVANSSDITGTQAPSRPEDGRQERK